MPEAVATKAGLRALALGRRAALSAQDRVEASRRAVDNVRALLRPGETVALFWPMRGEIDPREMMDGIEATGGKVAMPAVEMRRMVFRLFDGEHSLEDGVYGTRHPHAGQAVLDPDLIVAPLAAFDRQGGRIGYGGGFYDRATAALKERNHPFRLVGIAFACQEVEYVPVESHDELLAFIATERELIRVGRPQ